MGERLLSFLPCPTRRWGVQSSTRDHFAQTMTTHADHNEGVRLPAMLIGAISLVSCVLIALVGGYLSTQRGGQVSDGLNALIATVPGVLIPTAALMLLSTRPAPMWAVPVLGMTVLRALVVLSIGFGVFTMIGSDKTVFFMTLLASLLVTLGIDVMSVLSLIQKHPMAMQAAGESEGVC